jgi:hypothetical protein
MSNHVNRFYAAVSVLGGHGHIKQRLIAAYEDNLAVIEVEDLPIVVKQSFADLRHMMSRVDSVVKREGRICALVRKMSVEDTDKLTRRRGLALLDGDCSALYIDASAHSERVLRLKDA